MEHLEKLKDNLKEEIGLHPRYADLANMFGLLLTLQGDHSAALAEYERALGINPNYVECRANRTYALAALDRKDEAVEAAKTLCSEAAGNYDALVTCAKMLGWQGEKGLAQELLRKATHLNSDNPAAYHCLGLALLPENTEEACGNFDMAASIGSAYIALYDSLHIYKNGKVRLTRSDKQAVRKLLMQLEANPYTVKVYIGIAEMLAAGGQFDEASSQFDKAREIEPDSPKIENGLGLVAQAREYGEEAKLHFRRALQFDAKNITALMNLAFQLGAEGNLTEAEEQMRRAVEIAPRYPDLRLQLATILTEREQLDEAILHLREALSINPNYIFAAFVLASILFTKKRYQEVIDVYSVLDVEALDLPEVYSHLATSYLEIGKPETAIEIAGKAVTSENALPSSLVCLVLAHHRLGNIKEALTCAQEYIKRFPDGAEIEEMRRLLDVLRNTSAE